MALRDTNQYLKDLTDEQLREVLIEAVEQSTRIEIDGFKFD